MDPLIIASLAQAGVGAIQGIVGLGQEKKAQELADRKRPEYKINQPIKDNLALAESQAGRGLSDAALQDLHQGAERGITSSMSAILKNGGSTNNIADLYDHYVSGISHAALLDEQMRARNNANLVAANTAMSEAEDTAFQVNEYAPYADAMQAAAALRTQGNNNIWKGLNTAGEAAGNFMTGSMYGDKKPKKQTSITEDIVNSYPGLALGYHTTPEVPGHIDTVN